MATQNIADLHRRLNEVVAAIAEAIRRGKTNAGLSAIEGQCKARAALVELGRPARRARRRGRQGSADRD
jgi:hypothetical protein